MAHHDYLYRGLCGLARAHKAGLMAGHLGAAVIAGYFFNQDNPDLDDRVQVAIEGELDRIIGGEETVWFDPERAGMTIREMFAPFPEEPSQPHRAFGVIESLQKNIDRLRQSGHNVIFATLAFRALQERPVYATTSIIDGIETLIRGFDDAGPGRGYYGKERGWHVGWEASEDVRDQTASYAGEDELVCTVLNEIIQTASEHRRGYGGLFHVINHAAALVELRRLGFPELADRGLVAHRQHVQLQHSLPNLEEELGALKPAEHDPTTPGYWLPHRTSPQWSGHLTHRVKTLFGFYTLVDASDDANKLTQAASQMRYLMA